MIERMALLLEIVTGLRLVSSELSAAEWCRVLRELRPCVARVVVLRTMHGFTWEGIAERLDVSRQCATNWWDEGRRQLRRNDRVDLLFAYRR